MLDKAIGQDLPIWSSELVVYSCRQMYDIVQFSFKNIIALG